MSLINDMLKNLEKREIQHREVGELTLALSNQSYSQPFFLSKKLMVTATISAIVVFSFFFSLAHKRPHASMTMLDTPLVAAPALTLSPADLAITQPVAINGVTLQVKDNITEITFLLNHAALYRLNTNDMQNQLDIIISKSQLQAALPPVNYLNTAVSHLESQTLNGDTKFTLSLIPGAVVKYVNLNESDKNPELVIDVEYQNFNQNPVSASSSTVKTPAMQNLLTQQYQSALADAEAGQYSSAIEHLTSLLKIDPNLKDARLSLAALLLDQGVRVKAEQILDEGLNDSPDYVPFIELKARILAADGHSKQALALLQTASPPLEENPDYHAFIAAMYAQNNNHALAANLYKKLIGMNSHNGNWWFGLGVSLDKLGQRKNALTAYSNAMSEGHLNRESLAYLQSRMQDIQEAIDDKE